MKRPASSIRRSRSRCSRITSSARLWTEHPDLDPLGDLPTIGRIKGKHEYLAVPDDLTQQARWAKAQGHNVDIADHPDAEAAVRGIGSDGSVRSHLMAAVMHLLIANPPPDVTSFADHAIAIVGQAAADGRAASCTRSTPISRHISAAGLTCCSIYPTI